MKVEMTFNDAAVVANGYAKAEIYRIIKNAFMSQNLRCVSDNDVLSFTDNGREHDFAHIWNVIMGLIKSDWYLKCASSCTFIDDDNMAEEVLPQVPELLGKRA